MLTEEEKYIKKRVWKARFQSIPFHLCRIFPIKKRKIVFCTIEGTTGYTCNPKYIAEEMIRQNKNSDPAEKFELVWLVNDQSKIFPPEIRVVHNSLWKRAYELSTAHFWIDNSRKQLEVRKRKGQIYIQTWHAKLGFKPTCLDRGASFSRIAYLVSKHDSDMIDYVLSNSKWYDETLPTGMIYNGPVLRTGSPRCDILVKDLQESYTRVRQAFKLPPETKILMYAPTFRGGSQGTKRNIQQSENSFDSEKIIKALEKKFGGTWFLFMRDHPQLVARNITGSIDDSSLVDVSCIDDMYELLAGCDAFMTDYSSSAFDAAVMHIPVFLFAEDYGDYEKERGRLLWNMRKLPFPLAESQEELMNVIATFNEKEYQEKLGKLFAETEMVEDGNASSRVVNFIEKYGKELENGKRKRMYSKLDK